MAIVFGHKVLYGTGRSLIQVIPTQKVRGQVVPLLPRAVPVHVGNGAVRHFVRNRLAHANRKCRGSRSSDDDGEVRAV